MRRLFYILLPLLLLVSSRGHALVSHEWTIYPALGEITTVVEGGTMLYVLAGTSLYTVNTSDHSVAIYDKTGILSDSEISLIDWCATARKLVIVYSNQNIDLLSANGTVENIPDLSTKTMTGDKTVNAIDIYGADAYLSTGFGIVRINVSRAEVVNTYNLNMNVAWVHIDGDYIYAECPSNGQYRALMSDNLLDPASWQQTATTYTKKTTTLDATLLATAEAYMPNAPHINQFGFMRLIDGALFTVPGGSDSRDAAVQILDNGEWTVIEGDTGYEAEPRFRGFYTIDRDPTNHDRWLVGAIPGLYEYTNGVITNVYYWKNSILERAASVSETSVNYTKVNTLRFDSDGTAWLVQGSAPTPGVIKFYKGEFTRYAHDELLCSAGYSWTDATGLDFDSHHRLWVVNNNYRTPGIACYDPATDNITAYTTFINEDNSEINLLNIRCWAEDLDGNIWIGSDAGPAYLAAADIASGGDTFVQVKIPREDDPTLADYLLAGLDITCMAVDAGNRKWFGTDGDGVYVISADNIVEEEHFTAANSDLLSDNIEALVINNANGVVYISTDKGLCSYSSAVTETMEHLTKDDIYAYPNPVLPDYEGQITIVGLTYGAQVTITTTSGHLVKKGTSTGGSFAWDGTDAQGRRVVSGVYLVLITTADGKESLATKIAVVR